MGEKCKDKSIRDANSQVGVISDNVRIHGGVHFHHYPKDRDAADAPENKEPSRKGTAFDPGTAADILHRSDLHFGPDGDSDPIADANRWYMGASPMTSVMSWIAGGFTP